MLVASRSPFHTEAAIHSAVCVLLQVRTRAKLVQLPHAQLLKWPAALQPGPPLATLVPRPSFAEVLILPSSFLMPTAPHTSWLPPASTPHPCRPRTPLAARSPALGCHITACSHGHFGPQNDPALPSPPAPPWLDDTACPGAPPLPARLPLRTEMAVRTAVRGAQHIPAYRQRAPRHHMYLLTAPAPHAFPTCACPYRPFTRRAWGGDRPTPCPPSLHIHHTLSTR